MVPSLVVGSYSLLLDNMYNSRYFTYAAPAIALLIGAGVRAVSQRWLRASAVLAVALCSAQRAAPHRVRTGRRRTGPSRL